MKISELRQYTWDDSYHAISLLIELLEGSNFNYEVNDSKAVLTIKLDSDLDRVFFNNIISSKSMKDFLPDLHKKELTALKEAHRRELQLKSSEMGGLHMQIDRLQKTVDLLGDGFVQVGLPKKKSRFKFWN